MAHVVYLGVAMTDALRQFAFTIKPFAQTHPFCRLSDFGHELLHFHLTHLTHMVLGNGIIQLLQSKLRCSISMWL